MSRTVRNIPRNCYRHPQTQNERRQINSLFHDPDLEELGVILPNRYNRYIPNSWDDLACSSWDQIHKSKYPFQ